MPIRFSGPIRPCVIWPLRIMKKVEITASTTKANDTALAVSVLIWPAAIPVWITTSENSDICARLIAGKMLARSPCFIR